MVVGVIDYEFRRKMERSVMQLLDPEVFAVRDSGCSLPAPHGIWESIRIWKEKAWTQLSKFAASTGTSVYNCVTSVEEAPFPYKESTLEITGVLLFSLLFSAYPGGGTPTCSPQRIRGLIVVYRGKYCLILELKKES